MVSGCAAGKATAPESAAPASEPAADEPTTLDDALARFQRASADLDAQLGPLAAAQPGYAQQQGYPASTGSAPQAAPTQAPEPAAPAAGAPAADAAVSERADKAEGVDSRCAHACKAFDSLSRAADAICRIAGERDERCTRARDTRDQNRARVQSCGC